METDAARRRARAGRRRAHRRDPRPRRGLGNGRRQRHHHREGQRREHGVRVRHADADRRAAPSGRGADGAGAAPHARKPLSGGRCRRRHSPRETERCESAFAAALAARDADGAARAVLELEAAITAWSADTLQSDEADRARATLRSMIVASAEAAGGGLHDPRAVVEPFVDGLLAIRAGVRAEKRFDLSDLVRDQLAAAGVEVRDTRTASSGSCATGREVPRHTRPGNRDCYDEEVPASSSAASTDAGRGKPGDDRHRHAAIDEQFRPGDVAGLVGEQPQDRTRRRPARCRAGRAAPATRASPDSGSA